MENFNFSDILPLLQDFAINLVLAIITLLLGLWIIKLILGGIKRGMEKRDVDITLRKFVGAILGVILKIMLIISVISMVGVEMTSFVAILAAAGLAVGLALSGTLQNFAGGVILILLKPFRVGQFIEAQGHMGTVHEVGIFNTILKTPDNKTIIIPNGPLSTGSMTNFSAEPQRRVDFTFGIGYSDDIDQAKNVIKSLIDADERILKDPEPFIAVSELADSSVNFAVRTWVNAADYWGVFFDMTEGVKKAFDNEGVSIPFPQRDVHLFQEK